MIHRHPLLLLYRAFGGRRGVAAIEFTVVAPAIIAIFLGSFQLLDATTTLRKLTDTAVQLANVTAQYTTMSHNDVNNVLSAAATIMAPCSTTPMTIVLSEVQTDTNGNATVSWSQSYQGTPLATGSAIAMPQGFTTPNTSYIVVQTTYAYTPNVGASIIGSISMAKEVVMLPRASATIPFTG